MAISDEFKLKIFLRGMPPNSPSMGCLWQLRWRKLVSYQMSKQGLMAWTPQISFLRPWLSLGHILISHIVVADLFMYSLPSMVLLYLATPFLHHRCFCMRSHHFCKVDNNCFKQQINTSSWEIPGKVPNILQLNCLH